MPASQSLPNVTAAVRELTNLAVSQRVTLRSSQPQTIKQGFCCVVCTSKYAKGINYSPFWNNLIVCASDFQKHAYWHKFYSSCFFRFYWGTSLFPVMPSYCWLQDVLSSGWRPLCIVQNAEETLLAMIFLTLMVFQMLVLKCANTYCNYFYSTCLYHLEFGEHSVSTTLVRPI